MRTKKAFRNITISFIYQIISIVCGLITPRLILARFGSTYNGVVNSATHFLSMISILTIGITGATRVAFYKTLAAKDRLATSRIMKATKVYMRRVAIALVGYATILCLIYPYISHNELTHWQNTLIILIVSIGTFAQYFFGISNQTLLQADQSSYITHMLDIFKTVTNTAIVAILIKIGQSIYVVKLGSSLVFFITPLILELYVHKKYRLISNCEVDNTGIEQRGAVAFHSIANLIHNNVDMFLLTLFADAKIISVYTVYYLVVGKIKQLTQVVTSGIEAAFGNMWAKKEYEALKRNFRAYEYVMFTFTVVIFSCVGLLILPFIRRYTHDVTDVDYLRPCLAVLITVAEAFFCIRQPYLTLVQATGFYKETKNGAMFEAAMNFIISIVLICFIGIEGVIIGTLVANVFRTTQYALFISKRVIKRNMSEVIIRLLWTISTSVVIAISSLFIQEHIVFVETWSGWILEAVIIFAISCVETLISSLIFYRSDLIFVFKVFKRMIRNR